MTVTDFDPTRDLIIVRSRVWGRGRYRDVSLAVDTASVTTVVTPAVMDELGYCARDGLAITTVRSAIGEEQGYTIRVAKFTSLGFSVPEFELHVFDLATGPDIDGLIGLNFLQHFDYEVRSLLGKIRARPAVAEAISA